MLPPYFIGLTTHVRTEIVNGLILAGLTALNVAVALGIAGLRTDPAGFVYIIGTAAGLAFFEYLAVYRGLRPAAEQ